MSIPTNKAILKEQVVELSKKELVEIVLKEAIKLFKFLINLQFFEFL